MIATLFDFPIVAISSRSRGRAWVDLRMLMHDLHDPAREGEEEMRDLVSAGSSEVMVEM